MNALLKWILIVVGVVILLLVATAIVLPLTFDPNDYKSEISQAVKDETGRELTISGDIGWTVFPWLGLDINDVTLGNREGFGEQPMLVIGQASAAVKIMPLFSKKVEIGKVTLKDMTVNLSQKANGQNNWDDLNNDSKSDAPGSGSESSSDIQSIHISGIEVKNANVHWDDAGQLTELSNFNAQASGIADKQPFDLSGDFSVNLLDPVLEGDVNFSSHVIPAHSDSAMQLKNLKFAFDGQQGNEPDKLNLAMEVSTNIVINERQDSAALEQFEMRLHDMHVTGDLVVSSLSNDPVAKGSLTIADFNPKSLMKDLRMTVPETTNKDALTHFGARMNFSGSANGTEWRELKVKLDQSNFDGRFKITNFDQPDLDFNLAIDSINLDDYLPPADEADTTVAVNKPASNTVSGKQTANASETDLTSEAFRGLNGGGKFTIGQLKIADMTATNVSTTMTANNRGWRFYPTVADFYGGKNKADIRIDASGKRPVLTMSEDLSGVQAEGLLADITGKASRLLGTGSFKLNISTDLSNSATMRNALSGDLSMSIADGAFVGIDVADTFEQAKSLLGKQDESDEELDDDAQTQFALLGMTGLIKNGILTSEDFDMSSTLMRASGKGQISLIDETIDYVVKPVLSENVRGKGRSTLGKLSGVAIPIKISGSLYDPNISIDILGAITESQKAKIDEKKTELTNKLFDKLLGSDDGTDADTSAEAVPDAGAERSQTADNQASDSKSGKDSSNADTQNSEDPVDSLIDSLFSSNKDKKAKKQKKKEQKRLEQEQLEQEQQAKDRKTPPD